MWRGRVGRNELIMLRRRSLPEASSRFSVSGGFPLVKASMFSAGAGQVAPRCTAGASQVIPETNNSNTPINDFHDEICKANVRGSGIYDLRVTSQGYWGVFAGRAFSANELVFRSQAVNVAATRNSHSMQTDWHKHVMVDLPTRFLNHNCSASLGLRANELGAYDFFALRGIAEGEEFSLDYDTFEYDTVLAMDKCLCRSPVCRGQARGFKYSKEVVLKQYGDYYAEYLRTERHSTQVE
ncbi:unnamed protein product [Polarella glacialis]|uniref:SET domain-containing protein n=1 Tax=Polarella glacialis TaxID=89957 RepID=A0A813IXG2_POLGL|nr:unnamed protein product [Polarella glacialis]